MTIAVKFRKVTVNSILKWARVALDNGIDRKDWTNTARVKLYQQYPSNQYFASLEGPFCGAETGSYDTVKEAVEAAVEVADGERAKITAWVRKF